MLTETSTSGAWRMASLERAIEIAVTAHRGQVDKSGLPYILHPLRMMHQMHSQTEQIAAVLHDTVEDSSLTLEDIENEVFPMKSLMLYAVSRATTVSPIRLSFHGRTPILSHAP